MWHDTMSCPSLPQGCIGSDGHYKKLPHMWQFFILHLHPKFNIIKHSI